ncbi:thiol-disulfide oxidoreductase DCC family protein [Tenacibaculum amylolyticum]|uniref:hypothetical protein n=1 Tax=Tenacibaculum amylolyticum TaxID=104269 RepID=UPI00389620EA
METLSNHTLLYDKDCPLCEAYTKGFIKTKMLDEEGRKPFGQITEHEREFIDMDRATNEIALVDRTNEKVLYGIDSLLKIIGYSYPLIEKIGNKRFINTGLRKLYAFISYNRKVIIASKLEEKEALTCIPDFNLTYRFLFILIAASITGITLFSFSNNIIGLQPSNFGKELLVAVGQIVFQTLFIIRKDINSIIHYAGNLMVISLIGSIGVWQIMLLDMIIPLPQTLILAAFAGVVGLMFFEHKRRIKLLELPSYLSWTWVAYRALVLLLILYK